MKSGVLNKRSVLLTLLILSSVLFLVSILISGFMEDSLYLGIGTIVYIAVISFNILYVFKKNNISPVQLTNHAFKRSFEEYKNKK